MPGLPSSYALTKSTGQFPQYMNARRVRAVRSTKPVYPLGRRYQRGA